MLDFVVVGFQKCGTSAVRRLLFDHPEVAVPKGELSPFLNTPPWGERTSLAEFERAIAGQGGLVGAVDPTYSLCNVERTARSLAENAPDAKIITFERPPLERAYSAWAMATAAGGESRGFRAAIESCARDGSSWTQDGWLRQSYIEAGEYDRVAAAFEAHFRVYRLAAGDAGGLARTLGIEPRTLPTVNVGGYRGEPPADLARYF